MTISYYIRRSDADSQGYAPIYLRISHQRKQKYVSLDLKVLEGKWNPDRQELRRSHPDSERMNAYLGRILAQAKEVASRMKTRGELLTAGRVRGRVVEEIFAEDEAETELDFLIFGDRELDGYRRRGQYGTHKAYGSVWRKFKEFYEAEYGRGELPFSQVDARLVRAFRTYCYEVRKNNANTTGKALNILRTFVRAAIKEGYIDRADYPFEHITIDSEPVQKELLTPEEMEKLAGLDLPELSTIAEVRRWFLFAYYTGGMRFSDVATLQRQHIRDGRVHYRMEKTEDAVGVPLVDQALEILAFYDDRPKGEEAWVFPILDGIERKDRETLHSRKESRNAMANKYLRKMAAQAEIKKKVSFHLSRNAAAWKLYKETGDIYLVSKVLGHRNVEQTQEYLRGFEDDSLDERFRSVF